MKNILAAIAIALLASACTTAPCVPVTVKPDISPNCPVGGSICGACEDQRCGGTWPFTDKYCKTVYPIGGSCICRCQ